MAKDFHDFTSTSQFDEGRINRLAHLDAIPGFRMLPRECEYLKCYREVLKKELSEGPAGSIYLPPEDVEGQPDEAEEAVSQPDVKEAPKRTRRTTKAKTTEE